MPINQEISLIESNDAPTKGFYIVVRSLDNIVGIGLPISISIKIEFMNDLLGQSNEVNIENAESNKIDFVTYYNIKEDNVTLKHLDEITAHPLIFTVMYKIRETEKTVKSESMSKQVSTAKQKGATKPESTIDGSKSTKRQSKKSKERSIKDVAVTKTLGLANLDLLPLILGEPMITEVLILKDSENKTGSRMIAWKNLPLLTVEVSSIEKTLDGVDPGNIAFITLESLYNISSNFVTPGLEVLTALPLSLCKDDSQEKLGIVQFKHGSKESLSLLESEENMKCWFSLGHIQNRSALTKYRLNNDYLELKNTLDLKFCDLKDILDSTKERIQWNQLRRCWMDKQAQEEFYNKLVKYRCWPVEFKLESKENTKVKTKNRESGIRNKPSNRFVAFLDLSNLLYPGVCRTRVTSQLFTYVVEDVIQKWGEELFPIQPSPPVTPVLKKFEKPPTKSKSAVKSKADNLKPKNKESGKSKVELNTKQKKSVLEEEVGLQPEVSVPLFDEEGKPVFVIIEVEVMHSLVKKKTKQEVLTSVLSLIPERPEPEPQIVNAEAAQLSYEECIEGLIKVLNEQYENFHSFNDLDDDEDNKRFLMHLHNSGTYVKMSETLLPVIKNYMYNKLGFPPKDADTSVLQAYASEAYIKLVSEMNRIVNLVIAEKEIIETKMSSCTAPNLYYFAIEAIEQGNVEKANEYLLKRIEHAKGLDPHHWLDYAIFHAVQYDFERAEESVYEALTLNTRFKEGLLFYALLAWIKEDFETAELFFHSVTEFYPRYYQAWLCFYIFYNKIENKVGSSIAHLNGIKSSQDLQNSTETKFDSTKDHKFYLLSWCTGFEEDQRPFISTAILLLKLGFPEFAEMCLAKELVLQAKPTIPFLYYLAVSHYKQGRYTDSLCHLEKATHLDWLVSINKIK
uniref:Uncharacterized protein n=2 Tax=Clastoptera arizonana TaxID=38151 RepID=A0A1B6CLY0_9HEMI